MTHLAEVNLTHLGGARWRLFAADAESGASSGNQGVGKTWNGRTGDSEAVGHLAQYGTPQSVPLVPDAIVILEARKNSAACSDSEFVFPGAGESGHLVEPKKAWKIILDKAGIADLRLHDLRRTMGSWQAGTGANLSVIGRSLNHKSTQTTAIYARLWMEPVRNSMETAATAMMQAAGLAGESPDGDKIPNGD